MAKAGAADQKLLFKADAETGLLMVGTKYVVIKDNSLALADKVGTEDGVAAFTAVDAVAETLSATNYALGQAKLTKPVALSTSNKDVKFAKATVAKLESIAITDFDDKSKVTIEKFADGDYADKYYLKLGEDQYLQKDGSEIYLLSLK
ncbi:MAG: hypothetical protein LUD46_12420 [Parabacteroides sp.]|nr:hypothetical protein [Parabacteroides sp.]